MLDGRLPGREYALPKFMNWNTQLRLFPHNIWLNDVDFSGFLKQFYLNTFTTHKLYRTCHVL